MSKFSENIKRILTTAWQEHLSPYRLAVDRHVNVSLSVDGRSLRDY